MGAPLYRYAHDQSGRQFTEAQWVEHAWPHFIVKDDDTPVTYALFLLGIFAGHLETARIILAEEEEAASPLPGGMIGCPYCHHAHQLDRHGWVAPFPNHPAYYMTAAMGGWTMGGRRSQGEIHGIEFYPRLEIAQA